MKHTFFSQFTIKWHPTITTSKKSTLRTQHIYITHHVYDYYIVQVLFFVCASQSIQNKIELCLCEIRNLVRSWINIKRTHICISFRLYPPRSPSIGKYKHRHTHTSHHHTFAFNFRWNLNIHRRIELWAKWTEYTLRWHTCVRSFVHSIDRSKSADTILFIPSTTRRCERVCAVCSTCSICGPIQIRSVRLLNLQMNSQIKLL